MNQYITGAMIKRLREEKNITQQQLAEIIGVSGKAISKWENGRGYPDITLIEPLSKALNVSVIELFSGEDIINTNKAFNMLRTNFYVCPICGNIVQSAGESVVSCCGITLLSMEVEEEDEDHQISIEQVEDEYYITIGHEMSKSHFISFISAIQNDGYEIKKLYPEGAAEARFKTRGTRDIYYYCNHHGLFHKSLRGK